MAGLEDFVPLTTPSNYGLSDFEPLKPAAKPAEKKPVAASIDPSLNVAQEMAHNLGQEALGGKTAVKVQIEPNGQSAGATYTIPTAAPAEEPPPQWEQIAAAPKFRAMPFERQEQIRTQYFLDFIAPKVPTDQLDAAKASFDKDTKPTFFQRAANAVLNPIQATDTLASPEEVAQPSPLEKSVMARYDKLSEAKRDEIASRITRETASPAELAFLNHHERVKPIVAKQVAGSFPEGAPRPGPTYQNLAIRESSPEAVARAQEQVKAAAKRVDDQIKEQAQGSYHESLMRGFGVIEQSAAARSISIKAKLAEVADRIDRGERVQDTEDAVGYQYMTTEQRQKYRADLTASLGESIQSLNTHLKTLADIPQPKAVTDFTKSKSMEQAWDSFKAAPLDIIAHLGLESAPASAQMMAGALLGGAVAGPGGAAAGSGASSAVSEYGNAIIEGLTDAGVDVTDMEAVKKAVQNQALMEKVRKAAFTKSAVVGGFDAVAGVAAGKTMAPARMIATSPMKAEAVNIAAQAPVQGVLGAGGEVVGSALANKETTPGEAGAEFVGEFATTPMDIASMALFRKRLAKSSTGAPSGALPRSDSSTDAASKAKDAETPRQSTTSNSEDLAKNAGESSQSAKPGPVSDIAAAVEAIDTAANEAAHSPNNDLPEPTKDQAIAGNYKKGHDTTTFPGLDISIENPAGSFREDKNNDPPQWRQEMKSHYGYIKGTVGKDKDHVDVFIKPGTPQADDSAPVFVVNQQKANGHLDEHKVMLGFATEEEAKAGYLENYEKGWNGLKSIVPTTLGEFKAWLKSGDTAREFKLRTDTEKRKFFSGLSKEELEQQLYRDQMTGLYNRRALEEDKTPGVVGASDLDGLKWANDNIGEDAGDTLIKTKGKILAKVAEEMPEVMPVKMRDGGDEFALKGADNATVEKAYQRAKEIAANTVLTFTLPDGSKIQKTGIEFQYAIDKDYASAIAGVKRLKKELDAQNPNRRTDEPQGIRRIAAEGNKADVGTPSGRDEDQVKKTPADAGVVHLGTYGLMPSKNNSALTLKKTGDGYTLFQGEHEALDSETGDPITYASIDEAVADVKAERKRGKDRRFLSDKQGIFLAPEFKEDKPSSNLPALPKDSPETMTLAQYVARTKANYGKLAPGKILEQDMRTPEAMAEFALQHLDFIESALEAGKTVPDKAFQGHDTIDEKAYPLAAKRAEGVDRANPLDGQEDELDAEMRSYEDKKAPTYSGEPDEKAKPSPREELANLEQNHKDKKRFANNKLFTADKVKAARERMKKKFGTLNSGIDPELLTDGMTLAGAYIEAGVRDFAAYAKAMVEDFGDGVKPYLLSFYEAVRHYPGLENEGMSSPDVAAKQHAALITPEVEKAAAKAIGIKPKERKNAAADPTRTIRQDWGVPHIDGWTEIEGGKNQGSDFGLRGGMKDAFLGDSKKYLNDVAGRLRALGFTEHLGKKGKPIPAVTINEGGPAVSGDVILTMRNATHGVYVNIGATSMRGMGLTNHPQGVAIQTRVTRSPNTDQFATNGDNRWVSPDTTVEELVRRLDEQTQPPIAESEMDAQNTDQEAENGTVAPPGLESGDNQASRSDGESARADSRPLDGGLEGQDAGAGEGRPVGGRSESPSGNGEGRPGASAGNESFGQSREDGPVGDRPTASGVNTPPTEFNITDEEAIGEGNIRQKYRDNIAAIKLVKELDQSGKRATPEQQSILGKYVGWGGIKGVFNPDNKQWAKEYEELKSLLDEGEYAAARRSMLDAHYTSTDVIDGIYTGLRHLGYSGGRVLEPSIGVGNFLGRMPADLRRESQFVGVELDKITGQIVRHLYPSAKIATPKGFQDVNMPSNSFDLAVGNPPFGSQSIFDANHPDLSKFSLHNFFFAKSIDKLRPGGILGMVVSRYLMDSTDALARTWMAKHARLLGAVRLPYTAFKGNANTEVVTDIIFLQKLGDGVEPNAKEWEDSTEQIIGQDDQGQPVYANINNWYTKHPENVIGKVSTAGSMYKANEYRVEPNGTDLAGAIERALKRILPEGAYQRGEFVDLDEAGKADVAIPEHLKPGNYFVTDGVIYRQSTDIAGNPVAVIVEGIKGATADRVRGMIKIRDAVRNLMRAERTPGVPDDMLSDFRKELNKVYDWFVSRHGYLNSMGNRRAMADDPDMPLLESLEPDYDPGLKATSKAVTEKGEAPRPTSAKKADIFNRRVMNPEMVVTKAESAKDALVASLNRYGRVDPEYIEQIYGKSWDAITKELSGIIYNDPQAGWVTADEYLSGNVKAKLQIAKAQKSGDFAENIKALEEVQPKDLPATKIAVRFGSTWLPDDVMREFIGGLLKTNGVTATYVKNIAKWFINVNGASPTANESEFGIPKMTAVDMIPKIINNQDITVRENVGTPREPQYVVNEKLTEAARAKADEIRNKFKDWIWNDPDRAIRLAKYYNDNFNTNRDRVYNGQHLTLPGSNPGITLRQSQKDAIWRALNDRVVLLDHVVGAGKTYIMSAIAMELRRMGIAKKPLLVVPNHLVRSWRDEIFKLYPSANILVATEKDFEKKNRRRLFARIATGDWDAVVIGHSAVKKIGLPPESESKVINETLSDLSDAIEEMKRNRGDRHVLKDMERIKVGLETKLKKIQDKAGAKDDVVNFDELGVDAMMVDELHEFKNLFFYTQMQRVSGLGSPAGSGKAFDLFVKFRNLVDRFGERAVRIGATGTPVSNSLVEMFTMQRYMQYDEMRRQGTHLLDGWAGIYGDVQNVYEVHPSGSGYRMATRFAKFVNLQSLLRNYKSFADIITMDTLKQQSINAGKVFPVPKVKGGKPANVVAKRSDLQERLFGIPEFARDTEGQIAFELNFRDGGFEFRQDEKTGKWSYGWAGEKYHIKSNFETEKAAKQDLAMAILTPRTSYNAGSILFQFEHLKQLTKQSKGKINALSITNRARKGGLDFRLIDPTAPDFPESKLNLAVKNIKRIYDKWEADRGTQLVFCDLSVPLSTVAKAATKEQDAYVRDDVKGLRKIKATAHNISGLDAVFYITKQGDGFVAYDAMTGVRAEAEHDKKQLIQLLRQHGDTGGQHWLDALRGETEPLTDEEIQEWRDDNEAAKDEDDSDGDTVSLTDILALAGNGGRFSVYDDMREKLIAAGIPAEKIAFIHDYDTSAKKAELFKKVNDGQIRVLFGSTPKMGAGTNVQRRAVALHHLDAPWRPSDLEQREGRVIRQQNMLYERDPEGFEVELMRYATSQTYDTRMWQIIEHKASGVEQLRKADETTNEIEDIGGEAASSADMKAAASGNPLILEEIKLKNLVKSLQAQKDSWTNSKIDLQNNLNKLEKKEPARLAELKALYGKLIEKRDANTGEKFSIEVDGKTHSDEKEGMKALIGKVVEVSTKAMASKGLEEQLTKIPVGKYRGFVIQVDVWPKLKSVEVDLKFLSDMVRNVASINEYNPELNGPGLLTRLNNRLDSFEEIISNEEKAVAEKTKEIPSIKEQLAKPFDKEEALQKARRDHTAIVAKLRKIGVDMTPQMRAEIAPLLAERRRQLLEARLPTSFDEDTDPAQEFSQEEYEQMVAEWDAEGGQIFGLWFEREAAIEEAIDDRILRQWGSEGNPNAKFNLVDAPSRALQNQNRGNEQADIERLRRALERAGGKPVRSGAVRLVQLPDHQNLAKFAAAFGKRIVGFEQDAGVLAINGMTFPGGDVIYINVNSTRPHLAVLGHELGHQFRAHEPAMYDKLVDFVRQYVRQDKYRSEFMAKFPDLDEDSIREEFVGEVMSDGFMHDEFWNAMAGYNPSLLARVLDTLKSMLAKIRESLKPYTPKTDKYLTDYTKVMRAAGEAMARYQAGAVQAGEARFNKQDAAPVWYSALERAVEAMKVNTAPAAQWKNTIKNLPGVKADEIEAIGLNDWLDTQAKVTKQQVLDFVRANGVQVTEKLLGDTGGFTQEMSERLDELELMRDRTDAEDEERQRLISSENEQSEPGESPAITKFASYQLPSGENYRELLLMLPPAGEKSFQFVVKEGGGRAFRFNGRDYSTEQEARDAESAARKSEFKSTHFIQPNIIAHIRFNERTDADGNRVLFIEEIQSDWAQKGRKYGFNQTDDESAVVYEKAYDREGNQIGFVATTGARTGVGVTKAEALNNWKKQSIDLVPSAPFVTKTESWTALALKRMIRYAAEHGFDKVAWTNGRQQVDRYPEALRQVADKIVWKVEDEAAFGPTVKQVIVSKGSQRVLLATVAKDGKVMDASPTNAISKDLSELIGKPMAERVLGEPSGQIAGKDFTVGGKGMEDYYDKIVPNVANDVLKKLGGGRVETVSLPITGTKHRAGQRADQTLSSFLSEDENAKQPGFTINPELRAKVVTEGVPKFNKIDTWGSPEKSKIDKLIYRLQDKQIDLKRVIEAVKDTGKQLADTWDAYMKEGLFHGRVAKRVEDFITDELKPLLADMRVNGITMAQLEEYLHARHAKEVNEYIATINPDLPDGGSGMTNDEADAYMEGLSDSMKSRLKPLAKRVDRIIRGNRETLVGYGLESMDTIAAWESKYRHYVPLMRDDDGPGIGQGFSIRGKESKRRVGSTRAVVDIMANIVAQREKAIVRGEKNRVALALYGLAKTNPNPDFWKTDAAPMKKVISNATGQVVEVVDDNYKSQDNVIVAKYTTKAGNIRERTIIFNKGDERALRMARALKNLDGQQIGEMLTAIGTATRFLASVNTQYNPIFGVVNLIRDTGSAVFNLTTTEIAGKQKQVMGHVPSALFGVYADARKVRKGEHPHSKWADLWEEYQLEGGQTAFRQSFASTGERTEALQEEIKSLGEGKAKKIGKGILGWLSDYNLAMENAIRLSAYKVGIDSGMTKERAAWMAKNLTVNFNKKGELGVQAGALYAFFNASVQGTARLAETLTGPQGRRIIAGGVLMGVMQAIALAAAGFDDNEPPDFVRDKNLIIPIGGKRYLSIPMPLGLHVLPAFGRRVTEFAMSGGRDPAKKLTELIGVITDSFNPVGNSNSIIQTVSPTVFDPIAAVAANKDWTGRQIAKEDVNPLKPTPGHSRVKDTATPWARGLAYAINAITGGTEFSPGAMSPTPDQIDYLIGQVSGGIGREVSKGITTASALKTGDELPTHKIPLIGRFYGDSESTTAEKSKFFQNVKRLSSVELEIRGRAAKGIDTREYRSEHPEAGLAFQGQRIADRMNDLEKDRKRLIEKGDRARAKEIEAAMIARMKWFNAEVEKVTRR